MPGSLLLAPPDPAGRVDDPLVGARALYDLGAVPVSERVVSAQDHPGPGVPPDRHGADPACRIAETCGQGIQSGSSTTRPPYTRARWRKAPPELVRVGGGRPAQEDARSEELLAAVDSARGASNESRVIQPTGSSTSALIGAIPQYVDRHSERGSDEAIFLHRRPAAITSLDPMAARARPDTTAVLWRRARPRASVLFRQGTYASRPSSPGCCSPSRLGDLNRMHSGRRSAHARVPGLRLRLGRLSRPGAQARPLPTAPGWSGRRHTPHIERAEIARRSTAFRGHLVGRKKITGSRPGRGYDLSDRAECRAGGGWPGRYVPTALLRTQESPQRRHRLRRGLRGRPGGDRNLIDNPLRRPLLLPDAVRPSRGCG